MTRRSGRAHEALARAALRDQWRAARRHLAHVRGLLRSARKTRAVEISAVVARCRAARVDLRARLKAERDRVRAELRARVAHEREAVRLACIAAKTLAADEGAAHVARAKEAYDAAKRAEDAHRENVARARASRVDGKAPRSSAAERRSESDDEVRGNIPPELAHLWAAVKTGITASPGKSRTEAFLEYVEAHPGEAIEAAQDKADRFVKEHEAAEKRAAAAALAAEREAKRATGKRGGKASGGKARPRSSAASRTRPIPGTGGGGGGGGGGGVDMPAPRHDAYPASWDEPASPLKTKRTRKPRAKRPRPPKVDPMAKLSEDVGFLSGANLTDDERRRAIQAENDRNLPASVWRRREREARERREEESARARRASDERADQIVTVAYVDGESGKARAMVYAVAPQDDLIRVAQEAKTWADGAAAVFTRAQIKAWPARHGKESALREALAHYQATTARDPSERARPVYAGGPAISDAEHDRLAALRRVGDDERARIVLARRAFFERLHAMSPAERKAIDVDKELEAVTERAKLGKM